MKTAYTLLLLICANAKATTYYIDNKGNDSNNGTSAKTAWRTIAKVNASTFLPGDQILFKKGNIWNERLNPPSSGNKDRVITFGSYGTGAKPIITGLQKQSGFTNIGNIWSATATNSVPNLNTVLINGSIKAKARYPNTGYLTFTSYSGNSQITGSLTGTPDYTGAEIVVRSARWILDVSKITSQSGGTFNFSPALTYTPNLGGNGYFIQNSPLALDTPGEWTYDSTTKVLKVYSTKSPSVQISTIETLVFIYKKEYITFDGLDLTGANGAAVQLHTTNNIIIRNCSFNYSGKWTITGGQSNHLSIIKNSIQNSLSNAIYLVTSDFAKPGCDYVLIDNNDIKNTGTIAGMGLGQYVRHCGIYISGIQPTITNNRIDSTGYTPIMFIGPNSLLKNNYITNFCFVKDDGGGIHTVIGNYYPPNYNEGSKIISNIIVNGIGTSEGTSSTRLTNAASAGIYLDDLSRRITVDSNTIINCALNGININRANSLTIKANTVINNVGAGIAIYGPDSLTYGLNIKNNIFVSTNPDQFNFRRTYGTSVSGIDSNFYSRTSVKNANDNFNISGTFYNLSAWSVKTRQDVHSVSIPVEIASSTPLIYYNPKNKKITKSLKGTYFDVNGRVYKKSIVLPSFASAVLYKIDTRKFLNRKF